MRITLLAVAMALFASVLPVSAQAVIQNYQLNIPKQPLDSALKDFANQTGLQVARMSDVVDGSAIVGPVNGELSAEEALRSLLEPKGLSYKMVNERTIAVFKPAASTHSTSSGSGGSAQLGESGQSAPGQESEKDKSVWDRFLVAQATPGQASSSPSIEQGRTQTAEKPGQLQEVIVTARKRAESVENVPLSISVVSASDISERQLTSAADYLRDIPGVNQVEGGYGGQAIVIRGIASDTQFQNSGAGPTTATYFGETPTTSTGGLLGSSADIRLVDIERVEVLRGPQGTAFGDASLGGAVRTIPVAPKLDQFEGSVGAGYSETAGPGGRNNMFQGVLNVPVIEDWLAVRAVAYQFSDSGYYSNLARSDAAFQAQVVTPFGAQAFAVNQNQVGATVAQGGRIAALIRASDDLKFTLTYLTQRTEQDGWPVQTLGVPYEQTLLQVAPEHVFNGRYAGLSDNVIHLANAIGEYNLGWATLLGTYSYISSGTVNAVPFTFLGEGAPWPVSFDALPPISHREQVGELRLVTHLNGAWNFIAGLYFDKQDDEDDRTYYWYGDPSTNFFSPGQTFLGEYHNPRDLKQKAAFGEVTWEVLPGLTVLGGARYYNYDRSAETITAGILAGGTSSTQNETSASGTVGRANISYKPTPNSLIYMGWAQGFRLGLVQPPLVAATCQCSTDGIHINGTDITLASTAFVKSDSLNSFELGSKFTLLNRHLTIDADLFLTDWKNVPLEVTACTGCLGGYLTNAGNARSYGAEFQAKYQITDAFRVDLGGSWLHAYLTELAPTVRGGGVGDRLPGSPQANGNLGIQYAFNVATHAASVRADAAYVGSFYGDIPESHNLKAGGYAMVNATARVALRDLTLDFYVHNLTDRDSYIYRGAFNFVGNSYGFLLRPRTVGFQLDYGF